MKLALKNMVCDRCKLVVLNVLNELNLPYKKVQLGEVDFGDSNISKDQLLQLKKEIELLGFEFVNDKKNKLVDRIKKQIILSIQNPEVLKNKSSERATLSFF